jgi:hypothetical protein
LFWKISDILCLYHRKISEQLTKIFTLGFFCLIQVFHRFSLSLFFCSLFFDVFLSTLLNTETILCNFPHFLLKFSTLSFSHSMKNIAKRKSVSFKIKLRKLNLNSFKLINLKNQLFWNGFYFWVEILNLSAIYEKTIQTFFGKLICYFFCQILKNFLIVLENWSIKLNCEKFDEQISSVFAINFSKFQLKLNLIWKKAFLF